MRRTRHGLAAVRAWAALVATLIVQMGPASAANSGSNVEIEDQSIERIVTCFDNGQEAVLLADRVECAKYQKGEELLDEHHKGMPLKADPNEFCPISGDRDFRKLSGNAIKRIAAKQPSL